MFRTVSLSIIRSFSLYTQQWFISYSLRAGSGRKWFCPDPARKLSANLYVLLCVQWKTPDDGQRNCPKHVEFYSQNKSEKLVHVVGFIITVLVQSDVHETSAIVFRVISKQDKRIHKDYLKAAPTRGNKNGCKQLVSCIRNFNCMIIVAWNTYAPSDSWNI